MLKIKYMMLLSIAICATTAQAQVEGGENACNVSSWSPEIHTYYGDQKSIIAKVSELDSRLKDRRLYMLAVESSGRSDFVLFERSDSQSQNYSVSTWEGKTLNGLNEQIAALTLKNRGLACIGEQSKALVTSQIKLENKGDIPAPVSARAAFSHVVNKYGNSYVRVTVYLMC